MRIKSYPKTDTPLAWARLFNERLTQIGFPGEAGLTSAQYQCFQRLIGLMDAFVALSIVRPSMCAKEAFRALHDLAKNTIFQPEKSEAPVQILGLLEASGCTFDAVWMSGSTDQKLPTRTRLSAFIPIALQRDLDMPYANASREQRLAEKRITRLQQASFEQVFSYPELVGDIPALPSPLDFKLSRMLPETRAPISITHQNSTCLRELRVLQLPVYRSRQTYWWYRAPCRPSTLSVQSFCRAPPQSYHATRAY